MKKMLKKITAIAVAFAMFVTCTLTVFPAPSVQAAPGDMDFEDGYYYIKIAKSGKYVGLQGSPSEPGSIPVVSLTPMKWRVSHRNGKIQLSPEASSLTMEVEDGSTNEWGAKVQIWTNDSGYSCKEIQAVSAGYGSVCLRFEHSGYVLDVKDGAIYTEGTPLWQYRCNGTDAQKLEFLVTIIILLVYRELFMKNVLQQKEMVVGITRITMAFLGNRGMLPMPFGR